MWDSIASRRRTFLSSHGLISSSSAMTVWSLTILSCGGRRHEDAKQRGEMLSGIIHCFPEGQSRWLHALCLNKRTATLIQTSPFSHPLRDALVEAEGGGEEEVEEEERWGQEVLSWVKTHRSTEKNHLEAQQREAMRWHARTLTLQEEDGDGEEEERWGRSGLVGLYSCKKVFIDQHLLWVFPLKTARLFNKKGRQSTPDLSFLASSEGRLAGGGAWGSREEDSLLSFLSKCPNSTSQSAPVQPLRAPQAKNKTRSVLGSHTWHFTACTMHGRIQDPDRQMEQRARLTQGKTKNKTARTCSIQRNIPVCHAQAMADSWPLSLQVHGGAFDGEGGPSGSRRGGEAGGIQDAAVQHSSPEINSSIWSTRVIWWVRKAAFTTNQPLRRKLASFFGGGEGSHILSKTGPTV